MKKKILIFLISLFFVFLNVGVLANATTKTYYNDQNTANYTSESKEEKEIYPGTKYIKETGHSTRGSKDVKQEAHILMQKSNAKEGSKTVTWAVYNDKHTVSGAFIRKTLKEIAKDYELNHPGWKVIGGINADQYMWKYGTNLAKDGSDIFENHPYNAMKADGENWFSIDTYGRVACNLVGFKNDGSNDPLVYNNGNVLLGFKLSVIDNNGNLVKKFAIDELNPSTKKNDNYTYVYALSDRGNTKLPISRDKESKSVEISSSNDLYIVKKAEKAWVNNSVDYKFYKGNYAVNSFFGKGVINEISKNVTLKATDFAVETTNPELLKLLKKDVRIMCQYELGGGYELCEAGTGWHSAQKLNGKDNNLVGDSYNTKAYPRSLVGVTNSGETIFITGQGTTKSGWTANEINALSHAYDVKHLFQMDGGGSVTMILRNDKGEFVTVNEPSDGEDRSIFSGVFFVVKDVDYKYEVTKQTDNSLELNVKDIKFGKDLAIEETYITLIGLINGKPQEVREKIVNGKVSFTNLYANVEYKIRLDYKVKGETELRQSLSYYDVHTSKLLPFIDKIKLDKVDNNLKIRLYLKDPNDAVTGFISISFDGGKTYDFITNKEVVFKNFDKDPLGDIVIKMNYDLNDGKGPQEVLYKNDLEIIINATIALDSILYNNNQMLGYIFK